MFNESDHIFFTGGTGFFGKSILRYLNADWKLNRPVPQVDILSRNPELFLNINPEFRNLPWLNFIKGDIVSNLGLDGSVTYTHVLHAAANSELGPTLTPKERFDVIVSGTRNVLNFAVKIKVKRFLMVSSGGVYGCMPKHFDKFPEEYNGIPNPLNSNNAYGIAKRTAEHLCALYQSSYDIDIVIARCFSFVGQDLPLSAHYVIGNFIHDALWEKEILVKSDGTPVRSYLDQNDLAKWLLVLLKDSRAGRAYNVGSDRAITITELAKLIRDQISPEKNVRILGEVNKNSERDRYVPDTSKIRKDFGLKTSLSLEASIENAVREIIKCQEI